MEFPKGFHVHDITSIFAAFRSGPCRGRNDSMSPRNSKSPPSNGGRWDPSCLYDAVGVAFSDCPCCSPIIRSEWRLFGHQPVPPEGQFMRQTWSQRRRLRNNRVRRWHLPALPLWPTSSLATVSVNQLDDASQLSISCFTDWQCGRACVGIEFPDRSTFNGVQVLPQYDAIASESTRFRLNQQFHPFFDARLMACNIFICHFRMWFLIAPGWEPRKL